MIKRILKAILVLLILVVVFCFGFIITLQIFEYKPKDVTSLEISNNLVDLVENEIDSTKTIKILTFNTGYASLSATEDFVMDGGTKGRMDSEDEVKANIEGITNILTEQAADIYLLQEVDQVSDRSYDTDQVQSYQDALNMPLTLGYNYRVLFVPFPFTFGQMMGNVNSGIVTMANFYVEKSERIQLPGTFSWPLRLANLKRCITIQALPIQGSESNLIVINVHLSAYDDGNMRKQEMEALQSIMLEEYQKGNYVIVGGDFNQTFPYDENLGTTNYGEHPYELKDENLWEAFAMDTTWFTENGFTLAFDQSTPTCRLLNHPYDENYENNQYYLIDGFIVSSNITVVSIATQDYQFLYSDHNPVAIEIKLNSN